MVVTWMCRWLSTWKHSQLREFVLWVDRKIYWNAEEMDPARAPDNYFLVIYLVEVVCRDFQTKMAEEKERTCPVVFRG
jgi:hypothetical protein